ncbi:hypothetical protein HDU98_008695 [Podochytrium sp. JEL0797]|nr:hypothetical protein HDU98_008695 [Podochytrium sp. JEL0797]
MGDYTTTLEGLLTPYYAIINCEFPMEGVVECQNGNIVALHLADRNIVGEIPRAIADLTKLRVLELQGNQITTIHPDFANLQKLKYLNLGQNRFEGAIPDAIGYLREIETLYLYHNKFTGPVPTLILDMNDLKNLDLSENMLTGNVWSIGAKLESIQEQGHLELNRNCLMVSGYPVPTWLQDQSAERCPIGQCNTVYDVRANEYCEGAVPGGPGSCYFTVGDDNSACDIATPAV